MDREAAGRHDSVSMLIATLFVSLAILDQSTLADPPTSLQLANAIGRPDQSVWFVDGFAPTPALRCGGIARLDIGGEVTGRSACAVSAHATL
jgi:hypothetical protein